MLERIQHSTDVTQSPDRFGGRLEEAVRGVLAATSADRAAVLFLENLIESLGFERGFILASRLAKGGTAEGLESVEAPRVLASRVRRASSEWAEVRNPDFALNLSVVKRVIHGGVPVSVNDCLVSPREAGDETHRAVLCRSFSMGPDELGLLYLDRGLGRGPIGEAEMRGAEEFATRCIPILSTAYLGEEVSKLRAANQVQAPPKGAEEDEDATDGEVFEFEGQVPIYHGIVGASEKIKKVISVIEKIKDRDLNICVFGESGTGKELVARAIHDASQRRERPFVGENCAAIPETLLESELFGHVRGAFTGAEEDRAGLFETASGGTLFLDEIGDMSEGMQRKLLRVLEESVIRPVGGKDSIRVDVRVICSSNRDLRNLVEQGVFRADLFYRLNVITIEVPPLRERPGDVPLLVGHVLDGLLAEEGTKKRFSSSAMKALEQYVWPGNVRELVNVVRRAALTSPRRTIARKCVLGLLGAAAGTPQSGENMERTESELILRIPVRDSFNDIVEECERVVLANSLKQCGWNKSKVTKALKIPRQSLYNKIAKYRLERSWSDDAREGPDIEATEG